MKKLFLVLLVASSMSGCSIIAGGAVLATGAAFEETQYAIFNSSLKEQDFYVSGFEPDIKKNRGFDERQADIKDRYIAKADAEYRKLSVLSFPERRHYGYANNRPYFDKEELKSANAETLNSELALLERFKPALKLVMRRSGKSAYEEAKADLTKAKTINDERIAYDAMIATVDDRLQAKLNSIDLTTQPKTQKLSKKYQIGSNGWLFIKSEYSQNMIVRGLINLDNANVAFENFIYINNSDMPEKGVKEQKLHLKAINNQGDDYHKIVTFMLESNGHYKMNAIGYKHDFNKLLFSADYTAFAIFNENGAHLKTFQYIPSSIDRVLFQDIANGEYRQFSDKWFNAVGEENLNKVYGTSNVVGKYNLYDFTKAVIAGDIKTGQCFIADHSVTYNVIQATAKNAIFSAGRNLPAIRVKKNGLFNGQAFAKVGDTFCYRRVDYYQNITGASQQALIIDVVK